MNTDTIRELTQSIIAILVVAGTIAILYFQPASPALNAALALAGVVTGYYFSRATQGSTVSAILKAQDASKP